MTGNRGQRAGAFFRQTQERAARDLAVQGRLGVVRAARRSGAHPGPGRDGRVHGRARHGVGAAPRHGLEGLQPQPPVAGRGRRAVRGLRRLLPHQDHDGAVPGRLRAQPDAGAGQHRARDRRVGAARGPRASSSTSTIPDAGRCACPAPSPSRPRRDPDATAIAVRGPAPRLGEHTAAVLAEIGVDADALARLRAEGAI